MQRAGDRSFERGRACSPLSPAAATSSGCMPGTLPREGMQAALLAEQGTGRTAERHRGA